MHRINAGRRSVGVVAVTVAAAFAVVGCGGSDSNDSGGSASAGSTTASASPGIEAAQKELDSYRGVPKFEAPGEAFDARKAVEGKTILNIPASSGIPFVKTMGDMVKSISAEAGMKFIDWPNQGKPVQWVQGMNAALDRNANVVNLMAGLNPAAIGPQIKQASAKKIPVVASHLYDVNDTPTNGAETVSAPYETAGRLLANWVLTKTQGDGHVLVVKIDEVVSTKPMMKGIEDVFTAANCGEKCARTTVNVAIADVATKIQPQVQSALVKDPKIKYVIALYDSAEAPFVVAGIKASGKAGKVKVVTFNGTPSVLKLVKSGDVEMDVAENLEWNSYAITDQLMRLVAGLPPVKDPKLPLRIYDQSNVDEAGTNNETAEGFGDEYIAGYKKLWGLAE
jgi:ribose transport system substrate-binding protein